MKRYSLSHVADAVLVRELSTLVSRERRLTAEVLAHIAEVAERRLYAAAGYESMFAYCVGVLGFSEDAAYQRLQVAHAARRIPELFNALADGRLHLSGARLLAPKLDEKNAGELLAAAAHRSKSEIELLIARRFPRADVPTLLQPIAEPTRSGNSFAPGQNGHEIVQSGASSENAGDEHGPGQVGVAPTPNSQHVEESPCAAPTCAPRFPRVTPLAPERFAIQFTIDQATHDELRRVQALLSHSMPASDLPGLFARALKSLRRDLEMRKYAATDRPHASGHAPKHVRTIPAHVRRAVRERDGDQCTFVGKDGHRCQAIRRLEFDHIEPVSRGGRTTVANLRLRCRAHNQNAAEQTFGAGFMRAKRQESAQLREVLRQSAAARAREATRMVGELVAEMDARRRDDTAALRPLGPLAGERFPTAPRRA